MNVLVIVAHPNKNSFNHAIAAACVARLQVNGHAVVYHDLHEEQFDPLLPCGEIPKEAELPPEIATHCEDLAKADGIVVIHPNWWGQPPAILKGWIDRVIRPGVAYEFSEGDNGEGVPKGLLTAASAIVFNTSNTESGREKTVFGDPLESIWRSCVFDLCGVREFHRRMFNVVVTSSREQRAQWLDEVSATIDRHYPRGSHPRVVIDDHSHNGRRDENHH